MKRLSFLIALILITGLVIFLGCKGEQGDPGPSGSNPPVPPVITAVYAVPDSIGTNEYTTLIVSAYDPNGDALTFAWTATSGTLSTPNAAATNWTPDTTGLFVMQVSVSDDDGSVGGSVTVGVNVYVPSVLPSYLGNNPNICGVCHSDKIPGWSTTPHSQAFSQENIPIAHRVTGWDETLDNGGYDDNPGPHLENVQCEACHGPIGPDAGNHLYLSSGAMSGQSCGHCHAEHAEYSYSGHGTAMERAGGHEEFNTEWNRSNCWNCHIGEAFIKLWDADWADREVPHLASQVTCGTCHDPHLWSEENPQQIRTLADFVLPYGSEEFPDGYTVTGWGKGQLCGQCHHSRSNRTSLMNTINNGNQRAYPHYSPQADMVAGRGSYEIPGFTYDRGNQHDFSAAPMNNVCVSCHMRTLATPYEHTNHNFHPEVESCFGCHGTPVNFDINGKQTEIQNLMDQLAQMLPTHEQGEDGHWTISADTRDTTNVWVTRELREAAYAWQFVDHDATLGVHNYNYAYDLLTNAIEYLSTSANKQEEVPFRNVTWMR